MKTFMPWGGPDEFERDPSQDTDDLLAFRDTTPCGQTCHRPAHAFGQPTGRRHLEWFTAAEAADLGWVEP